MKKLEGLELKKIGKILKIISMHGVYGYSQWEDYSEHYQKGVKNTSNAIVVYQGFARVVALVTMRGRVLATNGMSVNELQYQISNGYIK